jgi:hypothetical protein
MSIIVERVFPEVFAKDWTREVAPLVLEENCVLYVTEEVVAGLSK